MKLFAVFGIVLEVHPTFFILPALLLFGLFSLYPFLKVFQLSVFSWDGISPHMQFVWLGNFRTALFHDPPGGIMK